MPHIPGQFDPNFQCSKSNPFFCPDEQYEPQPSMWLTHHIHFKSIQFYQSAWDWEGEKHGTSFGEYLSTTPPQQGLWLAGKDSIGILNPFTAGLLRNTPSANDPERLVQPKRINQKHQSQVHVNLGGGDPKQNRKEMYCGSMIGCVPLFPAEMWANRKWRRAAKTRSPQTHH